MEGRSFLEIGENSKENVRGEGSGTPVRTVEVQRILITGRIQRSVYRGWDRRETLVNPSEFFCDVLWVGSEVNLRDPHPIYLA